MSELPVELPVHVLGTTRKSYCAVVLREEVFRGGRRRGGARVPVCGSNEWFNKLNHATAQMNHKLAHQAGFHQRSTGAPRSNEPSIETLSRVSHANGARGSKGFTL